MTDEELVKRLRNAKATQDFRHTLEDEAADRIEALLNLNEALVELMDDRDAKLAKAVEVLEAIKLYSGCGDSRRQAITTLAEIEGEKE